MLGLIAQRLEHLSHKEQVAGSNPAESTHGGFCGNFTFFCFAFYHERKNV